MSKDNNTYNFNFYGNVGQNIAHVDKLEAHFDKDSTMTIAQVDNAEIKHPKNTTPQRKPRATKQGTKYTQATFEYKYFKQHSNRLALLFQRLQTNAKWIAEDTTPENFTAIFEGKSCDSKVKWIDSKARLYYLIRQLVERGLIKVPNGTSIWQITESHFIDKNSRHFHDLHKQKAPKRSTLAIDKLIDILDPSIKDKD